MSPAFSAYCDIDSTYYTVLVLAGIQLIFFVVDHTVLYFGFVTKTVLISVKAFSTSPTASSVARAGVGRRLGGGIVRVTDPN